MTNKSIPHKTFTQRWFTGVKYWKRFSFILHWYQPTITTRESIHGCKAVISLQ